MRSHPCQGAHRWLTKRLWKVHVSWDNAVAAAYSYEMGLGHPSWVSGIHKVTWGQLSRRVPTLGLGWRWALGSGPLLKLGEEGKGGGELGQQPLSLGP